MYLIANRDMLLKAQRQGYAVPALTSTIWKPCR